MERTIIPRSTEALVGYQYGLWMKPIRTMLARSNGWHGGIRSVARGTDSMLAAATWHGQRRLAPYSKHDYIISERLAFLNMPPLPLVVAALFDNTGDTKTPVAVARAT